jgi:hypothetical protein
MEKSAVEFLAETFGKHFGAGWFADETIKKEIEKAKEMFEQQIKDAYQTSHISMMTAEQYYNETFKQKP